MKLTHLILLAFFLLLFAVFLLGTVSNETYAQCSLGTTTVRAWGGGSIVCGGLQNPDSPDKLIANRDAKVETLHLSMEAFNNCEEWRIRECALIVYISAKDVLEAVELIELYERGL